MRILHLGKYYHPHRGGMETALREMAEGLLAQGAEVSVLVAGGGRGEPEPLAGGRGRLVRAWTPVVLNSQPLTPTFARLLRRELAQFRPDLVHLHLPNPLAALAWGIASRGRPPVPPLAVWHHADITRQRWGRLLAVPLQHRCLARAAGIAVSSEAHRLGSSELVGHRNKVAVVPFGLDPGSWQAIPATGHGPFLFIGRLVRYKGLPVLLEALREVSEARLVVIGTGPMAAELAGMARRLGVAARVEWIGDSEPDALRRHLAAARALILPSLDTSETFGLAQLEAMAAGVPVIASDLPTGVREVADTASSHLLVPPGDSRALAAALRTLLDDPARARAMGQAGRARQQRDFTRDVMCGRLLDWYGRLLATERT